MCRQFQLKYPPVAEPSLFSVIDALHDTQMPSGERVIAVRPASVLRGAAGADDRKWDAFAGLVVIGVMAMAVQPQDHAAAPGHGHQSIQVT